MYTSTVSNYLRLLKLPPEIQLGIRDNKITMGHARALINIDDPNAQLKLYYQIIDEDLSVRKVEERIIKKGKVKRHIGCPKNMKILEYTFQSFLMQILILSATIKEMVKSLSLLVLMRNWRELSRYLTV